MTTQAIMKARIADEISRSDLTSQIAYAISDAIALYQPKRFYFNEYGQPGHTFSTVADQETYTSADDSALPWWYDIDDVFVVVGVNNYRVKRIDPTNYTINQMPYFKGQPYNYMWVKQTLSLYPIPSTVYTIIVRGHYRVDAPASDAEANNPWMVDAERLIRSAAKRILYQDIILDSDAAAACMGAEEEAYERLKSTSNKMSANGFVMPMDF